MLKSPPKPPGQLFAVASALHEVVKSWQDELAHRPEYRRLEDAEEMLFYEQLMSPANNAARALLHRLEDASMPRSMIATLDSLINTVLELCVRSAAAETEAIKSGSLFSGPNSEEGHVLDTGLDSTASTAATASKRNAGIPIASTCIGRSASLSFKVFEKLGGWETVAAGLDMIYRKLLADPRVGTIDPCQGQALKTNMLEFLTAAFAGSKCKALNLSIWRAHQQVVNSMGLSSCYYDCMLEHFQDTFDELGLPSERVQEGVETLRQYRPSAEELQVHGQLSGMHSLRIFGRQSSLNTNCVISLPPRMSDFGTRGSGMLGAHVGRVHMSQPLNRYAILPMSGPVMEDAGNVIAE